MKTVISSMLLAFLWVVQTSAPGLAQEAQEKGKRFQACKADIEKFCADIPRGQHKTRPCLEANKDKLSDDCKKALEAPREQK